MRRSGLTVRELRWRARRAGSLCLALKCEAKLGHDLREALLEAGSPVWSSAEDLGWRQWIYEHGDEFAQALLVEVERLLEERGAELTAADAGDEGSPEPHPPVF